MVLSVRERFDLFLPESAANSVSESGFLLRNQREQFTVPLREHLGEALDGREPDRRLSLGRPVVAAGDRQRTLLHLAVVSNPDPQCLHGTDPL